MSQPELPAYYFISYYSKLTLFLGLRFGAGFMEVEEPVLVVGRTGRWLRSTMGVAVGSSALMTYSVDSAS